MLYSTAPVKKVTAVVEVKGRLVDSLQEIWKKTSEGSGISHTLYLDDYSDMQVASALVLGRVYQIDNQLIFRICLAAKQPHNYLVLSRIVWVELQTITEEEDDNSELFRFIVSSPNRFDLYDFSIIFSAFSIGLWINHAL